MKLNLAISILAVSLCVQIPGIAKAEVMLCPIETATITKGQNGDRIVCGNETDLKRCEDRGNKYKVERDVAIQTADQNLGLWMMCRIKLDAERSKSSEAQALNRAVTALSLTPVIPTPEPASVAPYIVGGVIGVLLGVGGTVAVILLAH